MRSENSKSQVWRRTQVWNVKWPISDLNFPISLYPCEPYLKLGWKCIIDSLFPGRVMFVSSLRHSSESKKFSSSKSSIFIFRIGLNKGEVKNFYTGQVKLWVLCWANFLNSVCLKREKNEGIFVQSTNLICIQALPSIVQQIITDSAVVRGKACWLDR